MESLTLKQKIHQMFILGYEGDDLYTFQNQGFIRALENGLGGVIFFTENIKDRTSFLNTVSQIKKHSFIEPFLSIDQEGGRVERTLNLYGGSHYLCARESAKKGEEFVKEQTKNIAVELKKLGLNMNFAPVLDVDTNPNNPVIAERSYSPNPDEVSKFGKIAAETYIKNGIIPVGKHFPGHGETSVDSHKEMPKLDLTFEELEKTHIKPFKNLLELLPAIMIAHINYTAFDEASLPASVSKNVINEYLRKTLSYKGLVISDDMVMGGIKGFTSLDACIKGINAGINMFIFRDSKNKTLELINEIEKAVLSGQIDIENIDNSVEIITKTKCMLNVSNR